MDLKTLCCKTPKSYSEKHDCYYCEPCNLWIEDICADQDCEFCKDRPLKPNIFDKYMSEGEVQLG